MKQRNRETGNQGEGFAVNALTQKGYHILERNFRNKYGEIDIIAKDKQTFVFVEVKTKTGIDFGLPEEMVGKGKLARVRQMATIYLQGKLVPCRIDVIAVILDKEAQPVRLTHYQNVY